MEKSDRVFTLAASLLIAATAFTAEKTAFHSLEWQLFSTPAGLIYGAVVQTPKHLEWLHYLSETPMNTSETFTPVFLALTASATAFLYVGAQKEGSE
ncbi:MAG: hypothetical protein ABEJ93_04935 [Candidatus Nanohalobium sp.]